MEQTQARKVGISATIPGDLYERLKEEAKIQKRSMAQVIEIILEQSLLTTEKKKGAKQ